jgi:hypothetical protein
MDRQRIFLFQYFGILLALLCSVVLAGQSITVGEYFFDTDPGVGTGRPLAITDGEEVDQSFSVDLTGLAEGFHTLGVRLRDDSARWSLTHTRPFLISVSEGGLTEVSPVTAAEYFFDDDPGVGNGTALAIEAGLTVDLSSAIATAGLAPGFHRLGVRVKSQGGHWSMVATRPFLLEIATTPDGTVSPIVGAECFFDNDPGVGNGMSLSVTTSDSTLQIKGKVETTDLAAGFHSLHIRFRNQLGQWGMAQGRPFWIDQAVNAELNAIVAAEYFFDDAEIDSGQGIPLSIPRGSEIELITRIDLAGLEEGDHRLQLRLKDNQGNWSYPEIKEFTVAEPRIDTIVPRIGGNTGNVTVNILGASFDNGSRLRFIRPSIDTIEVPDSSMRIINGEQIEAVVDLRNRIIGEYNLEIELNNGVILELPNAFLIEEGRAAEPWVDIIGFSRIRVGQWQSYTVVYGNRGNVDAIGVPLWIQIPKDSEFKLNEKIKFPNVDTISWDTFPLSVIVDTIHGKAVEAQLIPLVTDLTQANFGVFPYRPWLLRCIG